MSSYAIRPAKAGDTPVILQFIRELAEFEHLADRVAAEEGTLKRHLFGDVPRAECLLAEIDGAAVGFALYFHNFSTFVGRPGLYLEDIFVRPAFRRHGIGRGFFCELARIAVERDCGRIEWAVLDWNERAIAFYDGLGAEPIVGWTGYRLDRAHIETLAASPQT